VVWTAVSGEEMPLTSLLIPFEAGLQSASVLAFTPDMVADARRMLLPITGQKR
jgi:hypothetical protein